MHERISGMANGVQTVAIVRCAVEALLALAAGGWRWLLALAAGGDSGGLQLS